jgi:hypothetical protein
VETRLAQLEKYVCAESKLMKKEERLKEWLATGVGLPCNVVSGIGVTIYFFKQIFSQY